MTNAQTNSQTEQQRSNFRLAQTAGMVRHIAELNGGTGDLRRELSKKEADKIRSRRRMAKESRRNNRKGR